MNIKKTKQRFVLALLVGFCATGAVTGTAHAQFNPEGASVTYSMDRYKGEHEVQLARLPKDKSFELRFVRESKIDLAIPVHLGTVFREVNGILYYAVYSPTESGCTIVAYSLKEGKELWRTKLQALGQVGHSFYSNEINLGANEESIQIYGKETYGGYYEKLDPKTGKTLVNEKR